jgi:hypothetical protein
MAIFVVTEKHPLAINLIALLLAAPLFSGCASSQPSPNSDQASIITVDERPQKAVPPDQHQNDHDLIDQSNGQVLSPISDPDDGSGAPASSSQVP